MSVDKNPITTGVIVGCGSIGKKYLGVMMQRYETILIVDTDINYVNELNQLTNSKIIAFTEIDKMIFNKLFNPINLVAVISNWGPDHYATYMKLAKHGVQRIIIEKPLVTSIKLAQEISSHAAINNVKLISAMPRRYSQFYENIKLELIEESLGNPILMSMTGGAQCIATNGIHWLDLACQLFESFPQTVFAKIKNSSINPRNKKLGFYEGNTTWFFPEFKQLTINLTNNSYYRAEITIICEFGSIVIDNSGDVRMHKLSNNIQDIKNSPITRVLGTNLSKKIILGPIKDPILEQIRAAEGLQEPKYSLEESIKVLIALISAFESSENNVPIDINSPKEIQELDKVWNFS